MTSAHPPVTGAAPVEDEAAPAKKLAAAPDEAAPDAVSSEEATLHKSSSGAVLASQLPYPDKFHTASKLAGAPEHDALGMEAAERLLLYALFRQATDGSCTGPRPSLLDPVESAKYMSWGRLEGMSPIEVGSLQPSHPPSCIEPSAALCMLLVADERSSSRLTAPCLPLLSRLAGDVPLRPEPRGAEARHLGRPREHAGNADCRS